MPSVSFERVAAAADAGWEWARWVLGHRVFPPDPHTVPLLKSRVWAVLQPGTPSVYDRLGRATLAADQAQGHPYVQPIIVGFPSMAEADAFLDTAVIAIDTSRHDGQ